MVKNKLDTFKSNELPSLELLLVSGGIACSDVRAVIDAVCASGSPQCWNYCGFDIQCSWRGGTYYYGLRDCLRA